MPPGVQDNYSFGDSLFLEGLQSFSIETLLPS